MPHAPYTTYNKMCILMCLLCVACDESTNTQSAPPTPNTKAPLIALKPRAINNTIRDLFGMPDDPSRWPKSPEVSNQLSPRTVPVKGVFGQQTPPPAVWPWVFPHELGVEGFDGMAEGQTPSPYLIEELHKAMTHYAGFALVSPIFFACKNWQTKTKVEQKQCGWQSIIRFAQRAWRRPLSDDERARLERFWKDNWQRSSNEEAIALTVSGILQSPDFAFRVVSANTSTQPQAYSNWEMASRLSYLLWDSMPDEELFGAAARGELTKKDGLKAQAKRMLDDPKARTTIVRFHMQWLDLGEIENINPARRAYGPVFGLSTSPPRDTTGDGQWPEVLLPIRHSMIAETELFIERTIFDGTGKLSTLLTDHHGYMSEHTAPIYGEGAKKLGGPSIVRRYGSVSNSIGRQSTLTLYPVELPKSQRAGLLTLPSVLALGAYAVHPAPILRGKRILERLACQDFGPPPPGAEAQLPPDTTMATRTNRQRTEDATSATTCVGCHQMLNPPGFAFEAYDALGQWRTEDYGQPIDTSGQLTLWSDETFTFETGVDLSRQLAQSQTVRNCYVWWWSKYALGTTIKSDHPTVRALQKQFAQDDNIKQLLIALIQSDIFRYQPGETQ